jgi:hypothetical protein
MNNPDITAYTLGTLLSWPDEVIRRNAISIMKRLQALQGAPALPTPGAIGLYRIYDNGGTDHGGTIDRYTAYHPALGPDGYITFNGRPTSPDGFYQHGHGGDGKPLPGLPGDKRIRFDELPEAAQDALIRELQPEE